MGTTKNADGTYTSVGNGGKIGGKDVLAAKFKVLYQPNDFYRADFTYELLDDQGDAPATANDTPGGGAEAYLFPNLGCSKFVFCCKTSIFYLALVFVLVF